ncbi:MAG TPA: ThiF family adenylyltransferase [Steroidobacteraceae bacterium]|nr:ThiF family adenylyltransferase [Steroidobacteraceae bacterium]
MNAFDFTQSRIDPEALRGALEDPAAGGYSSFEGWVRNHNEGHAVTQLEYEAFELLARKEGERIVNEAIRRFGVLRAACVHRIGALGIGELAVWVGVSARHRAEAFAACRYIIDEVKHRVPIWKKEHYVNGDSGWVNCERCAAHGEEDAHAGHHGHDHEPERPLLRAAASPDYSRQIALAEVGTEGQARLRAARVLVIGAGGLGVPVLSYLAGAGVGTLGIVDDDVVHPSNLHRQTLYELEDAGEPKAALAAQRLQALNSEVSIQVHRERFTNDNAERLLQAYDLVIDCSDNFATKFALNDAAVRARKPAVFASVYQYEGQLQVYAPDSGSACLRCLWPEATRDGLVGNCAEAGVLGPVPGVFGSLQALEAMKLILGLPSPLRSSLLLMDLQTLTTRTVATRRCAECNADRCVRLPSAEPGTDELEIGELARARTLGCELIDVRDADEVRAHPLPFPARNVPTADLLASAASLQPDGRYVLICARGIRSRALASQLRAQGHAHVYSLQGGLAGLLQTTTAA